MVKFLGKVIRVPIESSPMDNRPSIIHVNDEGVRERGKTSGVHDGEIAIRPDAWPMSVAEQE